MRSPVQSSIATIGVFFQFQAGFLYAIPILPNVASLLPHPVESAGKYYILAEHPWSPQVHHSLFSFPSISLVAPKSVVNSQHFPKFPVFPVFFRNQMTLPDFYGVLTSAGSRAFYWHYICLGQTAGARGVKPKPHFGPPFLFNLRLLLVGPSRSTPGILFLHPPSIFLFSSTI